MDRLIKDLDNITHSCKENVLVNFQDLQYEVTRFHNTFIFRNDINFNEQNLSEFTSDYMYQILSILNNTYIKDNTTSLVLLKIDKIEDSRFALHIKDRLVTYLFSLKF